MTEVSTENVEVENVELLDSGLTGVKREGAPGRAGSPRNRPNSECGESLSGGSSARRQTPGEKAIPASMPLLLPERRTHMRHTCYHRPQVHSLDLVRRGKLLSHASSSHSGRQRSMLLQTACPETIKPIEKICSAVVLDVSVWRVSFVAPTPSSSEVSNSA